MAWRSPSPKWLGRFLAILLVSADFATAVTPRGCDSYSGPAQKALCEQLSARINSAAAGQDTPPQRAEAERYYTGQQAPWDRHGPHAGYGQHERKEEQQDTYTRDREYPKAHGHEPEEYEGDDGPAHRSHHRSYPAPGATPSVQLFPEGYWGIGVYIKPTQAGLDASGELSDEDFTSLDVDLPWIARLGNTQPFTINNQSMSIGRYFTSKGPVKMVVDGRVSNLTAVTVSGRMVPVGDANIKVGRDFPWSEAASYDVTFPESGYFFYAMEGPEGQECYGFGQATSIRAAPIGTHTMVEFLQDALFAEPPGFHFEFSAEINPDDPNSGFICFEKKTEGSKLAPGAAPNLCDKLTGTADKQRCQELLDRRAGRDAPAAAGPPGTAAFDTLKHRRNLTRLNPPGAPQPQGSKASRAGAPDSQEGQGGLNGARLAGELQEGRYRRDHPHHRGHHGDHSVNFDDPEWKPFQNPRGSSPSSDTPLLAQSSTSIRLYLEATNQTSGATGHLTSGELHYYTIGLDRMVQVSDATGTTESILRIGRQEFVCTHPADADFSFVGPVKEPTSLTARCMLELEPYTTINVGVNFPWREAIRTHVSVPSPTAMLYSVQWPNPVDFAYRQYDSTVRDIDSPLAFEGCIVDLLMDALLGRPPQSPLRVMADSFVLLGGSA